MDRGRTRGVNMATINNIYISGGTGTIVPVIPESKITSSTYNVDGETYAQITNVDLSGLSGSWSFPESINNNRVGRIGFTNPVWGSVTSLVFPYSFQVQLQNYGPFNYSHWISNDGISKITINAITGYNGGSSGTRTLFDCTSLSQLNVVSFIAGTTNTIKLSNNQLKRFDISKWDSSVTFEGEYPNLLIDNERELEKFSTIKFKNISNTRIATLYLTNCAVIQTDDTFNGASFEEIHLDNYIGDRAYQRRFANNTHLKRIYAPIMDTVRNNDFAGCTNIESIYTNADNVEILKNELSSQGYTNLVDKVQAIAE